MFFKKFIQSGSPQTSKYISLIEHIAHIRKNCFLKVSWGCQSLV